MIVEDKVRVLGRGWVIISETDEPPTISDEIEVNGKGLVPDAEGQKFFTLRAVTVKNGMWDSAEATYSYTLHCLLRKTLSP